ncbi:MAG: DegV family protein [Peptococcaceae bacterium]
MKVQLVTDSASDIPQEIIASHNIEIVPLSVYFGEEVFIDRVEITTETFYKRMSATKELPKTSQPAPHAFAQAYRRAARRGPVLCITLSSGLSGTYQSALLAAELVDFPVEVIDSLNVSIGTGLQVIRACLFAEQGYSLSEIKNKILAYQKEMSTYLTLDTLENAVKGGRVSPWEGGIAQLLSIKPVMHVLPDGSISSAEKVRGRKRAIKRVLQLIEDTKKDFSKYTMGIAHSCLEIEEINYVLKEIRKLFNPQEIIITKIGPVVGTHGGLGIIGVVV